MSILFHRHSKKALKYIWAVLAVIMIVGMIGFAGAGLFTAWFQ
jgi:hypothetical protein